MTSLYAPIRAHDDAYTRALQDIRARCAEMTIAQLEDTKRNDPDVRWRGIAAAQLDVRRAATSRTITSRSDRRKAERGRQTYQEEI